MTDIQEMSVRQLHKAPGEGTLWACVEAFQNERFRTVSGLPYSYHLKIGRRGVYTKECFLWIGAKRAKAHVENDYAGI